MVASLIVYALMGGADYGGGMWDLLASGPRGKRQRQAIVEAIAPIWESNHVWLILVVVLLFSGFPRAFSAIMIALHIPITAMLIGIVRFGFCISKIRFHRGRGSTAMEYHFWNREFLHAFFPGPNVRCIDYRQHPLSGRSSYHRVLRGLAYTVCVDLWVICASALRLPGGNLYDSGCSVPT